MNLAAIITYTNTIFLLSEKAAIITNLRPREINKLNANRLEKHSASVIKDLQPIAASPTSHLNLGLLWLDSLIGRSLIRRVCPRE